MDENFTSTEATGTPMGIGAQLRAAREEKGLSLEQVAAQTRIPQRHLVAIEAGDFGRLPGRTYAVGFSRTYAKVVGLEQEEVAAMVRAELDAQLGEEEYRPATFEPGDPTRAPSRALFYFSIFAAILVVAGIAMFLSTLFTPAAELPSLIEQEQAKQATAQRTAQRTGTASAQAAARPAGPVVFTAREEAWVRFYTPQGTLMEGVMAPGDSYTVPADADQPMVRTGRPDALRVTVGGREVPRLSEEQRVVGDVPVTAEALMARGRAAPAAAAGENPRPGTN